VNHPEFLLGLVTGQLTLDEVLAAVAKARTASSRPAVCIWVEQKRADGMREQASLSPHDCAYRDLRRTAMVRRRGPQSVSAATATRTSEEHYFRGGAAPEHYDGAFPAWWRYERADASCLM
jgi:hypothetical protein